MHKLSRSSSGLGIKFQQDSQSKQVRRPLASKSSSQTILSNKSVERVSSLTLPTVPAKKPVNTPSLLPPRKANIDPGINPYELLDEILGSALRDQAETFVRRSSSNPRVGSVSQFTPRGFSGAFGTATLDAVSPPRDRLHQTRNGVGGSEGRNHRSHTVSEAESSTIAHSHSGPHVRGASDSHYCKNSTGLSPDLTQSHSFSNLGNRLIKNLPKFPNISKRIRVPSQIFPFFTKQQEAETAQKVYTKVRGCERHENCTDCTNIEFAYWENLMMSSSIPVDERQKIIANNKSLRTIKNELENLLENGMISDETYDTMINALPAETSLNNAARRNVIPSSPTPTPDTNPLSAAISNMRINNHSTNEPPSYTSSTATPPSLPGRTPSQPPERPEIGRATSLYPYEGAPEDCSFAVGETLVIYEYMNNEWCYGKNLSTGKQGLFPTNYVQIKPQNVAPNPGAYGAYGAYNEKQNGYGAGYPSQYQQAQQGPSPPGPSNPYDSAVPPMAVAEQGSENKPGKGSEMGKKFGKKLGNAAIFGAGATIGGNIVNSIF